MPAIDTTGVCWCNAVHYLRAVSNLLHNPVFYALSGRDSHLGTGTDKVKYFYEEVSPFASFEDGYEKGLDDLYEMVPNKRGVLLNNPEKIEIPARWKILLALAGVQMVHSKRMPYETSNVNIVPLAKKNVPEMVALAA